MEVKLNKTHVRYLWYSANGLSGMLIAFLIIFVVAISSIIMMKIYVHTTPLVEQPLKFGRIEA